ncbi:MAG: acetyl-CoA hydrolase/transferase family protein [Deltaproteobacteria bacterium]|nr:acetyl-CoA hydrolase/transferase family protein [Deltaproteobacteria bacterium]
MVDALYRKKLTTPEKAVEQIKEDSLLVKGLGLAEPPALLAALAQRLQAQDLKKLRVLDGLPFQYVKETLLVPDLADCVDRIVQVGLHSYLPNHLHQMPRLISEFMTVDVTMTTVSPMDASGYFTFGASNDYTSTAARCAKRLIVEVNDNMPRILGESLLHISEVDAVVENHVPLLEFLSPAAGPEDEIIGRTIAEMVPDGATLQLGFGGVPSAVAEYLCDHKDLGIHTEVICPAMIDLVRKGVVTGTRKTLHKRKHIFTIALGDKEMMAFMNDNPSMESHPVSYTNHPSVIARNDNMISINAVLQVDLFGQANAESMQGHQFSGSGGQLDYVRGAFDAKGGKSILAFHATAKKAKTSRIVPQLPQGTMVTTPRNDVHWLVTEFGAANLKGKSTRERALAIIDLAHPDFRGDLLRAAEDMYLL